MIAAETIMVSYVSTIHSTPWYLTAFFLSDVLFMLAGWYALKGFVPVLISLVTRKKPVVSRRYLKASILGLLIGGAAMFIPVDRVQILTKSGAEMIVLLVVFMWGFVIAIRPRWLPAR